MVGSISVPSFATAMATIRFCSGVDSVSPWPIEARASRSSVGSSGKLEAAA